MSRITANQELTAFQVAALLIVGLLSVTSFILPGLVGKAAGSDGWIAILIAALIAYAGIRVGLDLNRRCPGRDIYQLNRFLLGRYIGALANIVYIVYNLLLVVVILRTYLDMVVLTTIRQTSAPALAAAFLVLAAYACLQGLPTVARLCELTLFMISGLALLLTGLIPYSHISYLLPVGSGGAAGIWHGVSPALNGFFGFQLLYALFPFIRQSVTAARGASTSLVYVALYNLAVFIAVVSYLGPNRMVMLPYASLEYAKSITLPTVERIDIVMLFFWAAVAIVSVDIYFYIAREGLLTIMGRRRYVTVVLVFVSCLIAVAWPHNPIDSDKLTALLFPIAIVADFIHPMLLWLLSRRRPRGVIQCEE